MKFILPLLLFIFSVNTFSQTFDEKFEHWPTNLKINGTIIAAPNLVDHNETDSVFFKISKGAEANILVIFLENPDPEREKSLRQYSDKVKSLHIAKTNSKLKELPKDLSEKIRDTTGVILISGAVLTKNSKLKVLSLNDELIKLIHRKGTLYTEGAVSKLLSSPGTQKGDSGIVRQGMDLIPDSIIETALSKPADKGRILDLLKSNPGKVGILIEKDTSLVLSGRKLIVLSGGHATLFLAGNKNVPYKSQKLSKRTAFRQNPSEFLIDLTQWRREAIDRTIEPFPPAKPTLPFVENGTLIIVGGGGSPKNLRQQFIDFAGGPEKAKLVYVPCSEADSLSAQQQTVRMWKKMGVKHATFIHTKDRNKANSDEEFMAPLKDATGIWFGGGRQWNMADSYYGTQTHKLMKDVLKRGGVVGGSSAGASIQARYLARATPIGNFDIMAPGYERGGLGFISGVAIDQHFSQRNRQKDMTQLVNKYPQMLGIGLDEATAIIVQKSKAKVVGKGKVYFYDRNVPVVENKPDYIALPDGSEYDLKERKVIKNNSPEKKPKP